MTGLAIWIVLVGLVVLTAGALALALVRGGEAAVPTSGADPELLSRELAELEAQAAQGDLPMETQAQLRAEAVRRFMAEAQRRDETRRPLSARSRLAVGMVVILALAVGVGALYARLGRPRLTNPIAEQIPFTPGAPPNADSRAAARMIVQMEARVRGAPRDPGALMALGDVFSEVERWRDAAQAYGRAADLAPTASDPLAAEGEAVTRGAGGTITDEARALFQAALARNPADPRARFYLAAFRDAQGDHAGAIADWLALLRSAPPGAPWAEPVRQVILDAAKANHIDLKNALPPVPPASSASAEASPQAQQAMIQAMVNKLGQRLKAQPRDPQGWIMLMRARLVLGDPAAAAQALGQARSALAGDAADLAAVASAAKAMGVPGA
jgi:cytochrome c-type biogenesis protein CcmH